MKKMFYISGVLALLVCFASAGAWAQAVTASSTLAGTVTDQSGAVVVGAAVTASSNATSETRTATTGATGEYRFDVLAPGNYTVKVTKAGFAAQSATGVELIVSRTTTQNFSLKPGTETQTVEVTGEAPLLDQQQTSVGLDITPTQVEALPLNGRDFGNLAYLAPGVKAVTPYDPTKQRYAVFAVNGSNGRNVNMTVNGVDNKDNTVGGPVMQLPLEAVQEFNISTQRFSAANGRSEGAAVNVTTKSGSNSWHGSGYVFDTETALNAIDAITVRSATLNGTTPQKSDFSRQQFGGSLGGPIIHDKDFIFGAIERDREHTAIPVNGTAFSELQKVLTVNNGVLCNGCVAPLPVASIPTPYFDWRYNGRIDHVINQNNRAFFSYTGQTNLGNNDQAGPSVDLTQGNFTKNELIVTNLSVNSVLTPRFVNAFTVGYQYWNNLIDTPQKYPTISFPDAGYGTNGNVPQQSFQKKYQFRDDMSYANGKHGLKWGVDYLWEPVLGGFFEFTPTPAIAFYDDPSKILSDTKDYPQGFSTPGAVSSIAETSGNPRFDLPGGAKMFGLYFQDDWRASSRLTLNLGVRYDRDFNLYGTSGASTNRVFLQLQKIGSPFGAHVPHDDTKDLSPRFGFAWDLAGNGHHIIRGGYGLYYGQTFLNIPLFMLQEANPTLFATVLSISGSGAPVSGVSPACSNCAVPGAGKNLNAYRFGVDPMPTIPPPPTDLIAGSSGRWIDPRYRNPYSQQWNLGYAWQWTPNMVVELDAVHELALHESKGTNINFINCPLPCASTAGAPRVLASQFAAAGITNPPGRLTVEESANRSRYDGLNVSLRRRMVKHWTVNGTYTLARAVGYRGSSGSFGNAAVDPTNPFRKQDFGVVTNDEKHHLGISSVLDLPWGFQIAPIMQWGSPRAWNATSGLDVYNRGSGTTNPSAIVPVSSPTDLTFYGRGCPLKPVDTAHCFSAAQLRACLFAGQCMETHFDQVRGLAYFQLDTRVTKTFKIRERSNLKLMFQGFDLTNRGNFGANYTTSVRSASFGQPAGYITGNGTVIPHSFRAEFGAQFTF